MLEQLRHEVFQDPHVGSGKVQPRLARCLLGPGRDDDDVGALRHCDVATSGHGRSGGRELGAVGEVKDLRFGFRGVDIEQCDVAGRTTDQGSVRQGGPDAPGSYNGKLGS
jgi:hypothetical protein